MNFAQPRFTGGLPILASVGLLLSQATPAAAAKWEVVRVASERTNVRVLACGHRAMARRASRRLSIRTSSATRACTRSCA
jgi:hypothetical protein